MKKSDIKFTYLDNNGNLLLRRHKLKRYKAKSLGLIYIKKVYKLKLKAINRNKIPIIKAQKPSFIL